MNGSASPAKTGSSAAKRTLPDASVKAAAGWIAQFARTLKTCRLYDPANPTVIKFRDELSHAAYRLVAEVGPVTYTFLSDDVTVDGESVYPARSRDDNLAYPFHRDGVRGLTLQTGVTGREIDAIVDCVLAVTGQNLDDDDLVTLLWEANLRHIDVDYVPSQGDVGGSAGPVEEGEGALLPWPSASAPEETKAEPQPNPTAEQKPGTGTPGRSEDWTLGDLTVEVEAAFVELDALAPVETERFRGEFVQEHRVPPVTAALAISLACLGANTNEEDRREMGRFVPRVLRTALVTGSWAEAREALRTLRSLDTPDWSEETFLQEMLQPVSIARVVEQLDRQELPALGDWLALAREVGDMGVDWMTLVLCESQERQTRMVVAEALAERCRDNPERLAAWLLDARWYVVRNIVYILGWIGGPNVASLLAVALKHPDSRVREQVVAALANVELKQARPLLIRALEGADTRVFCQVLNRLSTARDPATARFVFAFLQQEKFDQRPPEERRAIYATLASVGGDEIVTELEAELLKTNWFDRSQEIHRHNVARCLARIGTARAQHVLAEAAQSRRAPVRQAAQAAINWRAAA